MFALLDFSGEEDVSESVERLIIEIFRAEIEGESSGKAHDFPLDLPAVHAGDLAGEIVELSGGVGHWNQSFMNFFS